MFEIKNADKDKKSIMFMKDSVCEKLSTLKRHLALDVLRQRQKVTNIFIKKVSSQN